MHGAFHHQRCAHLLAFLPTSSSVAFRQPRPNPCLAPYIKITTPYCISSKKKKEFYFTPGVRSELVGYRVNVQDAVNASAILYTVFHVSTNPQLADGKGTVRFWATEENRWTFDLAFDMLKRDDTKVPLHLSWDKLVQLVRRLEKLDMIVVSANYAPWWLMTVKKPVASFEALCLAYRLGREPLFAEEYKRLTWSVANVNGRLTDSLGRPEDCYELKLPSSVRGTCPPR